MIIRVIVVCVLGSMNFVNWVLFNLCLVWLFRYFKNGGVYSWVFCILEDSFGKMKLFVRVLK